MAVIERHRANGNMGKGFIHGIGLQHGAIAGTVPATITIWSSLVDDASMMTQQKPLLRWAADLLLQMRSSSRKASSSVAGLMSDKRVRVRAAWMFFLMPRMN
jgi:adenine deaminase